MNKSEIIAKIGISEKDTGCPEAQVALLTSRINGLTEHFKKNTKDHAGRRGMLRMVSRRRSMLDYLRGVSEDRYAKLILALGLRR